MCIEFVQTFKMVDRCGLITLCILIPPAAVLIEKGLGWSAIINLLLCIFGFWIGGIIHAFCVTDALNKDWSTINKNLPRSIKYSLLQLQIERKLNKFCIWKWFFKIKIYFDVRVVVSKVWKQRKSNFSYPRKKFVIKKTISLTASK